MGTCNYPSRAGVTFNFGVYQPSTTWPTGAGLYMFCKYNPIAQQHEPVYIGQCDNFSARLCAHERWDEAQRAGATSVLLTSVPLQADRDRYEAILIRELQPKLNTQLRYG